MVSIRETSSAAIVALASSVVWQKSRKMSDSVSLKIPLRSRKPGSAGKLGRFADRQPHPSKQVRGPGVLLAFFLLEGNQMRL